MDWFAGDQLESETNWRLSQLRIRGPMSRISPTGYIKSGYINIDLQAAVKPKKSFLCQADLQLRLSLRWIERSTGKC